MENDQLIFNIQIAQSVQRYDDMVQFAKQIDMNRPCLDKSIQELILDAYKKAVNQRRNAFNKLMKIYEYEVQIYPYKKNEINFCLRKIKNEMISLCNDIIQLIDNQFLLKTNDIEEQALLLLLLGDYHRYLCEISDGNMKLMCQQNSLISYKAAQKVSKELSFINCTRSLFFYQVLLQNKIIKDYKKSYKLAEKAYINAVALLDNLNEDQQKMIQNILMILNNNLTNWSIDNQFQN